MNALKWIFAPFALLYYAGIKLRNILYDTGIYKSHSFTTNVIVVGNLKMGGTGKTPFVEYLTAHFLSRGIKLAILSRGYGRKTKGFLSANDTHVSTDIGDEPLQIYKKFTKKISVHVGEDRSLAIPHILHQYPDTDIILLDDAFQHRSVKGTVNLMLTEYDKPFYNDQLFPVGMLRENKEGSTRADAIIVTKCNPHLSPEHQYTVRKNIAQHCNAPVYFTYLKYGDPYLLFPTRIPKISPSVIVVTGIANASPLLQFLAVNYTILHHVEYADHHAYTAKDVAKIKEYWHATPQGTCIITTEKDSVKWLEKPIATLMAELPVWVIPIQMAFCDQEREFQEWMSKKLLL